MSNCESFKRSPYLVCEITERKYFMIYSIMVVLFAGKKIAETSNSIFSKTANGNVEINK